MMKARIIGAALLALVSSPSFAQQSCMGVPVDQGVAALERFNAERVEFLEGEAKARAVAYYNSLPPESNTPWPVVMIADLPEGNGFIAFGVAGVFCDRVIIPADTWAKLRRHFVGPEA